MDDLVIKNAGEKTIKCSDCDRPLMHYWGYAETNTVESTIQATCPFCGGMSFQIKLQGLHRTGPIGQDEPTDATVIEEIEQEDKLWKFKIRKRN
jgi:hypothetical protein